LPLNPLLLYLLLITLLLSLFSLPIKYANRSTVAGMVAGIASGLTIEKAFQQAVACGTATAFDEDFNNSVTLIIFTPHQVR
jgi:hypothetical protein